MLNHEMTSATVHMDQALAAASPGPFIARGPVRCGAILAMLDDVTNITPWATEALLCPSGHAQTARAQEIVAMASDYGDEGIAALTRSIARRHPGATPMETAERFATVKHQRSFERSMHRHDPAFFARPPVFSQLPLVPDGNLPSLPIYRINNPVQAMCVALYAQHQFGLLPHSAVRESVDQRRQAGTASDVTRGFLVPEAFEAEIPALELLKGWAAIFMQGLTADPCLDFDGYANGPWRMEHPASNKHPVSDWSKRLSLVHDQVIALMVHDSSRLSGASSVVAGVYASAVKAEGQRHGLTPFQPELDAIAALTDRASIEAHICDGITEGTESILGISTFLAGGVLDADLAVARPAAFYDRGANDDACKAYIDDIAKGLTKTGMAPSTAAGHAPVIFAMEARMAKAGEDFWDVQRVNGHEAETLVPGFPWKRLWDRTLGLKAEQTLYVHQGLCAEIVAMLDDVDLASWRAFLTFEQSRRAFPYMGQTFSGQAWSPQRIYKELNQPDVGFTAISTAYQDQVGAHLRGPAEAVFEAAREQYQRDIAASSFSAADRQVLSHAVASARFTLGGDYRSDGWDDLTLPDRSYRANILALRRSTTRARIDAIGSTTQPSFPPAGAHEGDVTTFVDSGHIRISPASLHGLPTDREGRWATWGTMIAHELGHLVNHARATLSPEGQSRLDRENEAIRQRYDGIAVGKRELDSKSTLEENSCDLRGLSIARRAAMKEAEADGATFDEVRFYNAYAQMWAANPTSKQLEGSLRNAHAPQSVRVNTAMETKGFDEAFHCPPRPRLPMDTVLGGTTGPSG